MEHFRVIFSQSCFYDLTIVSEVDSLLKLHSQYLRSKVKLHVRDKSSPSMTSSIMADSVEISKEYIITVIVMNILSDTGIIDIANEGFFVLLTDYKLT